MIKSLTVISLWAKLVYENKLSSGQFENYSFLFNIGLYIYIYKETLPVSLLLMYLTIDENILYDQATIKK